MLLGSQIFKVFPDFLLVLISIIILLWYKNMHYITSIFKNTLRSRVWSFWVNLPCAFKKNVYSAVVRWSFIIAQGLYCCSFHLYPCWSSALNSVNYWEMSVEVSNSNGEFFFPLSHQFLLNAILNQNVYTHLRFLFLLETVNLYH